MQKKNRKINISNIIVFEDDDYLVLNKPAHLSTLEDRSDPLNLNTLIKHYHPDYSINHRLDKETSGVIVVAKHADAYRHFAVQLEDRKVEKIYHAIVWGQHHFDQVMIEAPLEIKGNGKVTVSKRGKYSATVASTLEVFSNHSVIECKPITGRKHQIRVHLAAGDAPLINDGLYGGADLHLSDLKKKYKPKLEQEEVPLMGRFALHAKEISFQKENGETVHATTDYPSDMERVMKQLTKWG